MGNSNVKGRFSSADVAGAVSEASLAEVVPATTLWVARVPAPVKKHVLRPYPDRMLSKARASHGPLEDADARRTSALSEAFRYRTIGG